jgi:hypothetical protein
MLKAVKVSRTRSRSAGPFLGGAIVLVVSVAGCALFVGSPDGQHLFEAGVAVDAPACREDAKTSHHDAGKDSGIDVAHVDAHAVDARREGAPPKDAPMTDSPAHDAPASGFCATFVPPLNALYQCDDFDEDPDASVLGAESLGRGASLIVESQFYKSPPRALRAIVDSPDGSYTNALYSRPMPTGGTLSMDCDFLVGELQGQPAGLQLLFSFNFSEAGHYSTAWVYVNTGVDGGVTAFGVKEADPADGGDVYPAHPAQAVSLSGWTHMTFSITGTGGRYYDTLVIGGTTIEANAPLAATFLGTSPTAGIGITETDGPGLRELYVDNVVLMAID